MSKASFSFVDNSNIDDVKSTANNASSKADNAQTAADNAQTAADNAQTSADNAQTSADNAQTAADNAQTAADEAQGTADEAKGIASDTAQHFWFKSSGSDTGVHISEQTQTDFEADPSGGNLLARSNGIAVRDGLEELASFGADGVRVGKNQGPHVEFGSTSSNFYGNNNSLVGSIKSGNETVGEYTESVGVQMGYMQDNTIPITDAQLSYPPTGNLSLTVRVGSFQQTRTLPTTNDYDVITDGIRVRFIKSTRQLTVTNTGKKGLANHTFVDQGTLEIINGEKRRAVIVSGDIYTKRTLTLFFDPKAGTTGYITSRIVKNNVADSIRTTFTAGTAFTKTVTTADYGYSATLTYDGMRTFTLTPRTSGSAVFLTDTQYTAEVFNAYSTVATYDRKFLAPQFLFGSQNEADDYSYVTEFGEGLTAGAINQTIFGRFNAVGIKAFYVGNGSNSSSRSNAMEVDWSGNTTIAGNLTQSSDRRLKEHISYLDSDADDFIRRLKPAHYIKDDANHVGFYAQDVEKADKWACMVGEMNGYKTLGYMEIIAPLVKYCQHLEERIEALERACR